MAESGRAGRLIELLVSLNYSAQVHQVLPFSYGNWSNLKHSGYKIDCIMIFTGNVHRSCCIFHGFASFKFYSFSFDICAPVSGNPEKPLLHLLLLYSRFRS